MEQINRFAVKPKKETEKLTTSVIICSATNLFRMKTFGPKALYVYKDSRLIDHQVNCIRSINHEIDIVLTVGHMADRLIKNNAHGIRMVENQLYETTGIAEEIRLGLNAVNSNRVIIVDGDIYFNTHAFKAVYYGNSSCLLQGGTYIPDDEPGFVSQNSIVSNLAYDIYPKWGQMCMLTDNELKSARKILNSREKGHLLFHEIINSIIERGGEFRAVHNKDALQTKINNPKTLKNARTNQEVE